MPEGHTIHRVARDHQKQFVGQQPAVSSPQGRFRRGASQLTGRELLRVEAHGKHLFYYWAGEVALHIHLGLYGRFRAHRAPPPEPRGAVRLRVVGEERAFDLHGPTACELLEEPALSALRDRLGQDPLRSDQDPEQVWRRISRSRAAMGTLLLNQSVIAGIGNVYRAELLFQHGIHPERPGKTVSRTEFDALWETLVRWMRVGVRYNRIITADAAAIGKTPGRMKRGERLMIYKKQTCGSCGSAVQSWLQAARTIYACETCQQ